MFQKKFFPFPAMSLPLFLAAILLFGACQVDDDDPMVNEEELITSVVLTFTAPGGSSTSFSFRDTDGSGGTDPVVENITLAAASSYMLSVRFLDESNPADVSDITLEVADENTDHLVCFEVQGDMPLPLIEDTDDNGKPLGLASRLVTTAPGNGKLTVRLKHTPDKNATSPCGTGDTDVEATFNVAIN